MDMEASAPGEEGRVTRYMLGNWSGSFGTQVTVLHDGSSE